MKHQPTAHSLEEIEQLCADVETVLRLVRNNLELAQDSEIETLQITSFRNAQIAKQKLITFNQAVQRGIANHLTSAPAEKAKTKPAAKKKATKKRK